jgi:MSHA biogenesis protein MshQ
MSLADMGRSGRAAARGRRWLVVGACACAALLPLPCNAQTVLSLSFEEAQWTNGVGQAIDRGPFGLHGTPFGDAGTANAAPAAAGDPGTCRYGAFDGDNEYVEVADNAALDITSELTVAAWIYMRTAPSELHTVASKDTNYEFHIDNQRHLYWWWNDSVGNTRSLTTTTQIELNQWHHVAITYRSGEQRMYIDGALQGAAGNWMGALATNDLPFYVGTDWNIIARAFDGYIDEVRVVAAVLTPAQIQALRAETHPCAPARFTITHNAFGIHCLAEAITVHVVDTLTGTPLLSYNSQVQLDTQSNFGTWSLVAGAGTFSDATANDGVATYGWPLGQSQATFTLSYPEGPPSIDVDAFQISNTGVRDDDSEGPLQFSPSGHP